MMQAYGFSIQTIIVAANSSVVTGFRGDFIRNMETSGGVIYLGVDGQPVSLFPEAASYRLPAGMEFKEFKLENRSNADITVQVAVALGEVGYSALQTSATLDVNIVGSNQVLTADERPGQIPVGTSFTSVQSGSSAVLIDPVTNVNGVLLRTLNFLGGSNQPTIIFTGLSGPSSYSDVTKRVIAATWSSGSYGLPNNLYLPVGYGLWAEKPSGSLYTYVTYEVL